MGICLPAGKKAYKSNIIDIMYGGTINETNF